MANNADQITDSGRVLRDRTLINPPIVYERLCSYL